MPHGSLRGGALQWRFSIPNTPFVKLDLMTSIERSELLLKGHLPVMFLLVFDVPFYLVQVRLAHGKSGVSRLPVKLKLRGRNMPAQGNDLGDKHGPGRMNNALWKKQPPPG